MRQPSLTLPPRPTYLYYANSCDDSRSKDPNFMRMFLAVHANTLNLVTNYVLCRGPKHREISFSINFDVVA
jgi:hypothetical protein